MSMPMHCATAVMLGLLAAFAMRVEGASLDAEPSAPAQRIVTLSPDLTELVYTAGAGASLVGAIDQSDYPPPARSLPRVGDAFGLDFERIGSLRPDLILAWDGGTPQRWIERLQELHFRVVALGAHKLEDVAEELVVIGHLTGHLATARAAANDYLEQLRDLRAQNAGAESVSVFFQISVQPLYTVGGSHAISAMIGLCGGRNVFEDLPALAADVSPEAVLGRNPDVILAGDDAGDGALELWRRWPALTAVAHGDLYLVPAELVTRSSTRVVEGAAEICKALQRARTRAAEPAH
jgi:iron complex transport system substrate-binding protein